MAAFTFIPWSQNYRDPGIVKHATQDSFDPILTSSGRSRFLPVVEIWVSSANLTIRTESDTCKQRSLAKIGHNIHLIEPPDTDRVSFHRRSSVTSGGIYDPYLLGVSSQVGGRCRADQSPSLPVSPWEGWESLYTKYLQ